MEVRSLEECDDMMSTCVSCRNVKCWDSNSIGDEGAHQGGIGVNSDGFLRHWTRGASTLDLIVTEFQMVQTDGPGFSLCAVPLESFGPGFQDGRVDGMNEQSSRVYQTRVGGGGYSEERS